MGTRVIGSAVRATTRNKSFMEGSHWHCRRAPWALEHLVVVRGSCRVGLKRLPFAGVVAWMHVGRRFVPVGNIPVRHTPGALEGSPGC